MIRIMFVLLGLSMVSNFGLAQERSAGYIVNLTGDTTRGFIVDGTDAELSLKIQFAKEKQSLETTDFFPTDLHAFGFNYGRTFTRYADALAGIGSDSSYFFAKKVLTGKITMQIFYPTSANHPDMILCNNSTHRIVHLTQPKTQKFSDGEGHKALFESQKYLGQIAVVKGNSVPLGKAPKTIRYSESAVKENLLSYNRQFDKFPVTVYNPRYIRTYSITAGIASFNAPKGASFRIAAYMTKATPEKTRTIALIRGVSYRYWKSGLPFAISVTDGTQNYMQQVLTFIPIGLKLQSDSKSFRPYAYCGLGIAALFNTDHVIRNSLDAGSRTVLLMSLSLNAGVGIAGRIGSQYLLFEVTPTLNGAGIFTNLGYSF